jgi:hypothetical protein
VFSALLVLFACQRSSAVFAATPTPVLVELFTSEGCSSCPPADALLARLQTEQPVPSAEIIVLEEHVDYWESLGWHDRFSSHQFTERQSAYAQRLRLDSDYTPQMVVDGTDQFVGNDAGHALRSIAAAARMPKAGLGLSRPMVEGGRVSAIVSAGGTQLPKAELYAVLVDTMASTDVKRGENGGRTLHHVSVVRAMQRVGSLEGLAQSPVRFELAVPKDSAGGNLRVIVFAQREGQGAIVAATSMVAAQSASAQMAAR